jgi:hypothetical protein
MVNVITSLTEQVGQVLEESQEESQADPHQRVEASRAIPSSVGSDILHGTPHYTRLISSVTHLREAMMLCLVVRQFIVR